MARPLVTRWVDCDDLDGVAARREVVAVQPAEQPLAGDALDLDAVDAEPELGDAVVVPGQRGDGEGAADLLAGSGQEEARRRGDEVRARGAQTAHLDPVDPAVPVESGLGIVGVVVEDDRDPAPARLEPEGRADREAAEASGGHGARAGRGLRVVDEDRERRVGEPAVAPPRDDDLVPASLGGLDHGLDDLDGRVLDGDAAAAGAVLVLHRGRLGLDPVHQALRRGVLGLDRLDLPLAGEEDGPLIGRLVAARVDRADREDAPPGAARREVDL